MFFFDASDFSSLLLYYDISWLQNGTLKSVNMKQVIIFLGFPGGAVVKNLPANAGDKGSSLGPGRSHMLQSN